MRTRMTLQAIRPGVGIGDIVFGLTMNEVRTRFGEPDEVETDRKNGLGENAYSWTYSHLEIELHFGQGEDYRLGSITSNGAPVTFEGVRLIGLSEAELIALQIRPHGSPRLDSSHEPFGRDYTWDKASVSCWVSDGVVTSVTVMPHAKTATPPSET